MEEPEKEQPKDSTEPDMKARVQTMLKDFEAKFREHVKDLDETVRSEFRDAVPQNVTEHLKKSKQEFLLAVRGIVDRQLEKTRQQPSENPPPPPPKTDEK